MGRQEFGGGAGVRWGAGGDETGEVRHTAFKLGLNLSYTLCKFHVHLYLYYI